MKKITISTIIMSLMSLASFSQTLEERQKITANYELEKLDRMAREASEKFTTRYQEALKLAPIMGWHLIKELPNGGKAQLIGVTKKGNPIYISTDNKEGAITTRTNKVHTGGDAGLDLNGENMIIGIFDGGRVRETHELFNSSIIQVDGVTEIDDHATHVAGTLIGSGNVQSGNAKGMAPEATLWAHDAFNAGAEWVDAAANGMLISNHSYHLTQSNYALWEFGYYSDISQFVDDITFNAPFALPVVSASNFRDGDFNTGDGGYDYLLSLAVSKNVLTVAAVNEVLDYTGPSSVVMSSFSSWGPTDDGRIKPDISAKGVAMYSSVGDADDSYANYNGTSMATPNTTGSLILLQQYYNALNGNYMTASTLKGLAIHTADEAGNSPGPDYRFGWGLLNIENAANAITNNGTTSFILEEELQNGDLYTFSVQSNNIDKLSVSISWTDTSGVPLSPESSNEDNPTPMLVNDLDLRVSKDGGETFFPWKLDPSNFNASAITGDNLVDNIEKVEIVGATGEYTIQVSHKGDVLTNNSQAFSLIVTGIEEVLNVEDFETEGIIIYPNPTSDNLNIQLPSNIEIESNYVIKNTLGQTVFKGQLNNNRLNISSLQAGVYFIQLETKGRQFIKRFIKK